MFKIEKIFIEETGSYAWAVAKRDGSTIEDGIMSYNFNLADWELAIECSKRLSARFS